MKATYIIIMILLFWITPVEAQQPDSLINDKIRHIALIDTRFNSEVDISVGRISLAELLRNVAKISGVNLSVRGGEDTMVSCNFSHSKITDLLQFLCLEYNLDFDIIGNIVSVYPASPPTPIARSPRITYSIVGKTLSYDIQTENLINVSKKISGLASINIVIPQSLWEMKVSAYVNSMPLDEAVTILASTNGLRAQKSKNGVWTISQDNDKSPAIFTRTTTFAPSQLLVDSMGMVTAQISQGEIDDVISDICQKLHLNYFFINPINCQTSIFVRNVTFKTLLDVMFTGTQFSYYIDKGIYFFGQTSVENSLSDVEILTLQYRSVNRVVDVIPTALKSTLQLTQFADLNSIVVSGNRSQIARVSSFISSIDKPVPLIIMDVIIVDAQKSQIMEVGVGMGIGTAPTPTIGTLSPGVDLSLGASSVNRLINSFNGFGSINIGKVTPEFYMNLKLLEEDGVIELRSTPKLSTLNGHEATMKSGETKFYKEVVNNIIGTQNPIQSEAYTWKSIEANLDIKITPFVSTDNLITLDIEIEQSEFTTREEKSAPPGTATRSFKSLIKVQNEDMVLLGGIDRNTVEKNSAGLPFISRIPILKWLFGHTKDNKTYHKLNVFIKPTIIQ